MAKRKFQENNVVELHEELVEELVEELNKIKSGKMLCDESQVKEMERIKEDKKSMEVQYKEQLNRLTREIEFRDSRISSMSFNESIKLESSQSFESENENLKKISATSNA